MADIQFLKEAAPSTPATNNVILYSDTNDGARMKAINDAGVISTLNNTGDLSGNILYNGGMLIQQRVATASTAITGISTTTRAGVVADRWAVTTSVASNLNWAQIDSSGSVETNLLARYYGSIISSSAGKKVMISQWAINRDMAHLRGQKVRLSVKHNQKVGSGQLYHLGLIQLNASGTVDTSPAFLSGAWSTTTGVAPAWNTNLAAISPDTSPTGENGTVNGSYLDITTVATTWVRSSCVFSIPTTAKNLVAVFFSDATGGTTDNISVTEFQLTQGPEIIDYVEPFAPLQMYKCRQFFSKSFPATVVPAVSLSEATAGSGAVGAIGKAAATALAANYGIVFPVEMWKVPTMTFFTPTAAGAQCFRLSGTTPAVQTATAVRTNSTTTIGTVITATGDVNGAVGDLVGVHYTADAEIVA